MRKKTRTIKIGNIFIGGNNPIAVQSMTKTPTKDVRATVAQIKKLEGVGCQIVRCAVRDTEDAEALKKIKAQTNIPLVADIHFNYKHAVIAAKAGVDKLRINPGNIGSIENVREVVAAARDRKIPIRIGVNSGSVEKDIQKKYKHVTAKALVESALKNISILEKLRFRDIVVSIKSTSVPVTIEAYRLLSKKVKYPLHVGVTEAGTPKIGMIRSSVGIGTLLAEGIGDTIRVSLTADPVEEVRVAKEILKCLEFIEGGVAIISCPTCGRCDIDVEKVANEVEERTRKIKTPIRVAIMGCEVNGPGEAADADVGLAGGRGLGLIFREGRIVRKVSEDEMVDALVDEIESMAIK
jgi:(E)-4-hydroxy-3-methylbut-2-enyl-diphosphate synthase